MSKTSPPRKSSSPNKPSFLSRMGKAVSVGLKEASSGLEKGIKHVNARVNKDDRISGFYQIFPEFDPALEPVLASCEAVAITNTTMKGRLSLTPHYVCFNGAGWIDGQFEKRTGVRVVIPHMDIVRIARGVSRGRSGEEKANNPPMAHVPLVMPYGKELAATVPISSLVLQLYTKDNLVHQFYSMPDFATAFNLVNYIHINVKTAADGRVAPTAPVTANPAPHTSGVAQDGPPPPQYPPEPK